MAWSSIISSEVTNRIQNLALLLMNSVTLGKSLHFAVTQFPHLQMGDNHIYFAGYLQGLHEIMHIQPRIAAGT